VLSGVLLLLLLNFDVAWPNTDLREKCGKWGLARTDRKVRDTRGVPIAMIRYDSSSLRKNTLLWAGICKVCEG